MDFAKKNILFIFTTLFFFIACNDNKFELTSTGRLAYSTDTITFDTVFTTIGTVTRGFKVYNQNDKYVRISKVYLKEGEASNFRFSIDGSNSSEYNDVEIPPNDSLYIFVEATLDPVNDNLPVVVEDAIIFNSNGNTEAVILEAFGQDMHFYDGEVIESETWINDKPYLIYKNLVIGEEHTLTIPKGVKVFLHHNSSIVTQGKLIVEGTLDEPVEFNGDRFDLGYDKSAGRWGTIFFLPGSTGNKLEYAVIKNAVAGLQVGRYNEDLDGAQVELVNTQILNSSFSGIIAFGSDIDAYNTIIADAQLYGLLALMGGNYNFYHSTISINGAFTIGAGKFEEYSRVRDGLAVALLNYYSPYYTYNDDFIIVSKDLSKDLNANFYNSIIYGNSVREFDTGYMESAQLNYFLDHCLVKSDSLDTTNVNITTSVLLNEDPKFVNDSATLGLLDLSLDTLSPAKDFGSAAIINQYPILEYDYNGNSRIVDGKPDLGAYERIE